MTEQWVRLDVQDGTNCRSCGMTRSNCEFVDLGEDPDLAKCCDDCNHSADPDAFGIVPASAERGGPKDMWAVTYRGKTLCRWDRIEDARADMLDRQHRAIREARNG